MLLTNEHDNLAYDIANNSITEMESNLFKLPLDDFENLNFEELKKEEINENISTFYNNEEEMAIEELHIDLIDSEDENLNEEFNNIERVYTLENKDNNLNKKLTVEVYINNEKLAETNKLLTYPKYKPVKAEIKGGGDISDIRPKPIKVSVVETNESQIINPDEKFHFDDLITNPKGVDYRLKFECLEEKYQSEVLEIELKPSEIEEITAETGEEDTEGRVVYELDNTSERINLNELNFTDENEETTITETITANKNGNFNVKFPQEIEYNFEFNEVDETTTVELKDPEGNVRRRERHYDDGDINKRNGSFETSSVGEWEINVDGDTDNISDDSYINYKIADSDNSYPYLEFDKTFDFSPKENESEFTVEALDDLSGIKEVRVDVNQHPNNFIYHIFDNDISLDLPFLDGKEKWNKNLKMNFEISKDEDNDNNKITKINYTLPNGMEQNQETNNTLLGDLVYIHFEVETYQGSTHYRSEGPFIFDLRK